MRLYLVHFDHAQSLKNNIESEWIIGSGTISSTVDEIRISDEIRSSDWILATYQNQNNNPSFPTSPNQLIGTPSFTSDNKFIIPAEVAFTHFAKATGSPNAYVGTGLPGGLLLNPVDGNLSGIPATAGTYQPNLRAVYADGSQATQSYEIEVLAGPPQVTLSTPQRDSASSLQIPYEVTATGGDDPIVWVLADTVDQGTNLYKWKYRFDLGYNH